MSTKFKVGDIITDPTTTLDNHAEMSVIDVKTTKQGTQYYIVELCGYNLIDVYTTKHIDEYYIRQLKFKVGDVIRDNEEVSSENDRVVVGIVTSSKGNKSYLTEFANSGYEDEVNAMQAVWVDEKYVKIGDRDADRTTDTRTA